MNILTSCRAALVLLATLLALPAGAITPDQQKLLNQLNQLDQLDQLDHLEFVEHLEQAQRCTAARDFLCSEQALKQARKVAGDAKDKRALEAAQVALQKERKTAEQERQQIALRLEQDERDRQAERREARRLQREIDDAEESAQAAREWRDMQGRLQRLTSESVAQLQQNERNIAAVNRAAEIEARQARERETARLQAGQQRYSSSAQTSSGSAPVSGSSPRVSSVPDRAEAERAQERQRQQQLAQADQQKRVAELRQKEQAAVQEPRNQGGYEKQARERRCTEIGGTVSSGNQCEIVRTIWSASNQNSPEKTWLPIETVAGVRFSWKWFRKEGLTGENWTFLADNGTPHEIYVGFRGMARCSDGSVEEVRSPTGLDIGASRSSSRQGDWGGVAERLCAGKNRSPIQGGGEVKLRWRMSD